MKIQKKREDMYRLLEIHDAYETLQKISESLIGYNYSAGFDEGVIGKLAHVVRLIIDRTDPSLFDKTMDFSDTELARILEDTEMDNRHKAEILTGSGK